MINLSFILADWKEIVQPTEMFQNGNINCFETSKEHTSPTERNEVVHACKHLSVLYVILQVQTEERAGRVTFLFCK